MKQYCSTTAMKVLCHLLTWNAAGRFGGGAKTAKGKVVSSLVLLAQIMASHGNMLLACGSSFTTKVWSRSSKHL